MDVVVLAVRVGLAAVFTIAAVGKLLDLRGSRESLAGFGVPERAARVLGTLLPVAELATAVALLLRPSARWGAVAALVLLLLFIAGIANALRHGQAPDCNCFGAIHSAPAGRSTLVRNSVLAVAAAVAVGWGPGPAIDSWISARSAAELVAIGAGLAALVLALTVGRMRSEIRRMRDQLGPTAQAVTDARSGLRIGTPAPGFAVQGVNGEPLTLASLRAGGLPIVLVFVAPGCGPCHILLPDLRRWQATVADRLTIGLVGAATATALDPGSETNGSGPVPGDAALANPIPMQAIDESYDGFDDLFELFRAYRIPGTPGAVAVTPDGMIDSATVGGGRAVEALIRWSLARAAQAAAASIVAPSVERSTA